MLSEIPKKLDGWKKDCLVLGVKLRLPILFVSNTMLFSIFLMISSLALKACLFPLLYDLLLKFAFEFLFNREDEIEDIQKVFPIS